MNRLKELREARGLTIRELANKLDMNTHSMINRYELGQTKGMKYELIIKFCEFFNVTPNYLLGYDDQLQENSKQLEEEVRQLRRENRLLKEIIIRQNSLLGGESNE